MASTAQQNYEAFESLRSRFGATGDAGESGKSTSGRPQLPRSPNKRSNRPSSGRSDPRSNAPPLVPLVEEGDQLQERLGNISLVRGKWKHTNVSKSNHLNFPDYDALETASVTSCSSAYSSKSESSVMSPPYSGSATELSDAGFYEDDGIFMRKTKNPPRPLSLGAPRKGLAPESESEDQLTATSSSPDADIPEKIVRDHASVWNKAIGEWKFEGISSPCASPLFPYGLRVTNEVRLPTPTWTPQGSAVDLLDSESRSSLLSSEDECREEGGVPEWRQHHRVGKFLRGRSGSTSNLASAFQSAIDTGDVHHIRPFSSDILGACDQDDRGNGESDKEAQNDEAVESEKTQKDEIDGEIVSEKEQKTEEIGKEMKTESKDDTSTEASLKETNIEPPVAAPTITPKALPQPSSTPTQKDSSIKKVSERISLLKRSTSFNQSRPPTFVPSPSRNNTKWTEAYNKAKALRTVQESHGDTLEGEGRKEGEEEGGESTVRSGIKERAMMFGGATTKPRRPLKRSQSAAQLRFPLKTAYVKQETN